MGFFVDRKEEMSVIRYRISDLWHEKGEEMGFPGSGRRGALLEEKRQTMGFVAGFIRT